jgi:hypothetical protein
MLWSPSKLHRLETADNVAVEVEDVVKLCEMYGADAHVTEKLKGYAKVTKTKKDWWESPEYSPGIRPGFSAFLGLEAVATSLHAYENEFVPGLLQTEAYVRVIHRRAHQALTPEEIDREVAIRMTRQQALRRATAPLRFAAIINETVLRQAIGGAEVMREQLLHIADVVSTAPNVRVQVVPYKAGSHPGMNGPFTVMHFRDHEVLKPIVYLENLVGAWTARRRKDVERYEEAFEDLQAMALSPVDSLQMIKAAIEEH